MIKEMVSGYRSVTSVTDVAIPCVPCKTAYARCSMGKGRRAGVTKLAGARAPVRTGRSADRVEAVYRLTCDVKALADQVEALTVRAASFASSREFSDAS